MSFTPLTTMIVHSFSLSPRPLADPADGSCPSLDEAIVAVRACLSDSPSLAGHRIRCEAAGNRVVLRGYVPTYSMKQMARVLAESVSGDHRVEDRLDVIPFPAQWKTSDLSNSHES